MLKIILDDREHKLIEYMNTYYSDSINLFIKHLDVADIVVSKTVGIERKEGNDFAASIKDNRLAEQMERLKEAYECPVLLVEGLNDDVFENCGLPAKTLYSVLARYAYQEQIAVIQTRNLEDTAIAVERFAFREQVKKEHTILARSCPKALTLEQRRAFVIEGILDCGPKKAQLLTQFFKTPANVFEAIRLTDVVYTKTGKPSGITGILKSTGLKGFGHKFVLSNKKLIFDIEEAFNPIDTAKITQKKITEC